MNQPPSQENIALWAQHAGLPLPETALAPLSAYLSLLMQWNRVMNLVGTHNAEETFSTLIVDSLHLAAFLEQEWSQLPALAQLRGAPTCWDLGSGAGLPGIPLRCIWQRGTYWLVEAREKRALFLSTVLARVPLPGTHVFRGRAEAFMAQALQAAAAPNASPGAAPNAASALSTASTASAPATPPATDAASAPTTDRPPRLPAAKAAPRPADLVVSRAFMPWPAVLELVRPGLNPGGVVIFLLRRNLTADPLWAQQTGRWHILAEYSYPVGKTLRWLCAAAPAGTGTSLP